MTSANLLPDLKRDEGFSAQAYPDPIHGWAVPTIGYGHTSPDVHEGVVWTQTWAEQALVDDVSKVCAALDKKLPWWRQLDDVRQDIICEMGFNLGVAKLMTFETFLGFVKTGQWAHAALDLLGTAVARQLPTRYRRLAQQMRTGVHQP